MEIPRVIVDDYSLSFRWVRSYFLFLYQQIFSLLLVFPKDQVFFFHYKLFPSCDHLFFVDNLRILYNISVFSHWKEQVEEINDFCLIFVGTMLLHVLKIVSSYKGVILFLVISSICNNLISFCVKTNQFDYIYILYVLCFILNWTEQMYWKLH